MPQNPLDLNELQSRLLKGDSIGDYYRVIRGDTRSLDYCSHVSVRSSQEQGHASSARNLPSGFCIPTWAPIFGGYIAPALMGCADKRSNPEPHLAWGYYQGA